jgi:hypothetical protein
MIVRGRWQAQLLHDAGDVLLHGTLRDHQPVGDAAVGATLGHQLEYFSFSRS